MILSTTALAFALIPLAFSHPLEKRQNALPPVNSTIDASVLQLALYLEHLELNLYTGGFVNFTDADYTAAGFPPGFRENVGVIADHERVHASTISTILSNAGYTPVPPCSYKFPYNDPRSFVNLANMITTVGIGAYLGGGSLLTDDPALLTAASSILTVESRHDAYLRTGIGASPFPTSFDTALTAVFAYNLAQMFVVSCPQQLPIPILPKLNFVSPAPPPNLQPPTPAGTTLQFTFDPSTFLVHVEPSAQLYIGLLNMITNVTFVETTSCGDGCVTAPVPEGAMGVAFAVLSTFNGGLNGNQLSEFGTLAGPAEVVLS
ncbi:MAG: hypothetical protein LQ343_004592 [Gyalolechia ehrenbergii]|nr:MAG: hypothetical protein LQ343_004592 [Gyalolechia ehrenbergii]